MHIWFAYKPFPSGWIKYPFIHSFIYADLKKKWLNVKVFFFLFFSSLFAISVAAARSHGAHTESGIQTQFGVSFQILQ